MATDWRLNITVIFHPKVSCFMTKAQRGLRFAEIDWRRPDWRDLTNIIYFSPDRWYTRWKDGEWLPVTVLHRIRKLGTTRFWQHQTQPWAYDWAAAVHHQSSHWDHSMWVCEQEGVGQTANTKTEVNQGDAALSGSKRGGEQDVMSAG